MKKTSIIFITLLCLFITSCSSQSPETSTKETTADGLVKIKNSTLDLSFEKQNTDWKKYTKIYFAAVVADGNHPDDYKPPAINRRIEGAKATYELRLEDLTKLVDEYKKVITEVYRSNDTNKKWQLVELADKNTLTVTILITDIRLGAPREDTRKTSKTSGSEAYSIDSGSMLMLAEFKDGSTGEVVGQAIDRGKVFDRWSANNKTLLSKNIKSIFRSWLSDINTTYYAK